MLSLSMSFLLLRCWARSRGLWRFIGADGQKNPRKNTDLASTRPAVLAERGRGRKQALTRARTWVESILGGPARGWVLPVSSQIPLLIRALEARPSSAGHEFVGSSARPPRDCTRREHSLHQEAAKD